MNEKILCVDDDPNILAAYKRGLRKRFHIETAPGGAEGLEAIASDGPFSVVVSDMRMPGMDGVQFLKSVQQKAPNSVRMMLTGDADQQTAIEAVNEGNIFRFLTKPCPPEHLAKALDAGVEQYRLITAEKELLGKTLRGSIKVLNDVLTLSNPIAFGHASRVRPLVSELCKILQVQKTWECEVAAMLSQIGCVTIPPDTLEKMHQHRKLSREESEMVESHPAIGKDLVANIPRLESVADIIAYQQTRFDGTGMPLHGPAGDKIPIGARILKVALDYDAAKSAGQAGFAALSDLRTHAEWYDPEVLAALEVLVDSEEQSTIREIPLKDLGPGMFLAEDVKTVEGAIVVPKGQEVSPSLCARINNFARHREIEEPIHVYAPADSALPAGAHT